MAAGTPVVALGKLGVYDILSQEDAGGIMIKDLNEDDFSHEILKLLKDLSSYEVLKKKAKIFVKDNYSIEKCVDMILELYKREILTV
jgi:glycosyltransferase involved in cell wall biosynthesis